MDRSRTEGTTSPSKGEFDPDGGECTRGCYILLIRVPRPLRVRVGALGKISFAPGSYAYVGSAMGGLSARLSRHFRKRRNKRWHIDYLLDSAKLDGATIFPSTDRLECALAEAVSFIPGVVGVKGFGSSDCGCPAHLFFLRNTSIGEFLSAIYGVGSGQLPYILGTPLGADSGDSS
ncbi:MAG: GIY-YIG nuclease family protein [Thermoplasmata archaeon]